MGFDADGFCGWFLLCFLGFGLGAVSLVSSKERLVVCDRLLFRWEFERSYFSLFFTIINVGFFTCVFCIHSVHFLLILALFFRFMLFGV